MDSDVAKKRAEIPGSASSILDARTLHTSHKRLSELVTEGMSVLDVGCGTGTITKGIAEIVGSRGRVVGIDQNPAFVETANESALDLPMLSFMEGDVYDLPFENEFDMVTSARVLQWLSDPVRALRTLIAAAKPGGKIIILDYNHEKIKWEPEPPESTKQFYRAFLKWRADAGMDNEMADHLEEMYGRVGLSQIHTHIQDEVVTRSDPDFMKKINIWADVMTSRGKQMVRDGFYGESELTLAEKQYREWVQFEARSQCMYLRAVEGSKQ
ncbi:class I SAM-dependent methyltransferase [Alkalicoccobacillus porphyridii]|uniref:Methyltransferase domain-containing protein n=1 Tax=Alkalicoccobacillus porphyridii TaxID=2597270 RepID=A0A553ZWW1_9BACI|nr:methyltransferase domain-containing protein [Alkalicoccobacillus porphyridii]TSB45950.1 methyltransferase domain-containing protein [Alkalicoccobacillus porphyridii]